MTFVQSVLPMFKVDWMIMPHLHEPVGNVDEDLHVHILVLSLAMPRSQAADACLEQVV